MLCWCSWRTLCYRMMKARCRCSLQRAGVVGLICPRLYRRPHGLPVLKQKGSQKDLCAVPSPSLKTQTRVAQQLSHPCNATRQQSCSHLIICMTHDAQSVGMHLAIIPNHAMAARHTKACNKTMCMLFCVAITAHPSRPKCQRGWSVPVANATCCRAMPLSPGIAHLWHGAQVQHISVCN